MHWETKKNVHVTHFIAMFNLFPWSGTEHAISLRYFLRNTKDSNIAKL